jgi:hypothetical protein
MLVEMAERLRVLDERLRQYDLRVARVFGQDERCHRLRMASWASPQLSDEVESARIPSGPGVSKSHPSKRPDICEQPILSIKRQPCAEAGSIYVSTWKCSSRSPKCATSSKVGDRITTKCGHTAHWLTILRRHSLHTGQRPQHAARNHFRPRQESPQRAIYWRYSLESVEC